jgi:imidazolonepropionase-like amidohydrolase
MQHFRNANIVVGDGITPIFTGCLSVDDGRIVEVSEGTGAGHTADTVDLRGRLVLPGAIDIHAHAVTTGPRFASATPSVSHDEATRNAQTHLRQGHTTVVDLDGLKIPTDRQDTPTKLRIEAGTIHFDPMFEAADQADGAGLSEAHRRMTVDRMFSEGGAVVIGEVGAGMTLGGGGQDYIYIPAAIERHTGITIKATQATELKYAVLGRHVRPGAPDVDRLRSLLAEYGLAAHLDVPAVIRIVEESVLPSFKISLDGIVESARIGRRLGAPVILHNSAPSDEACREAASIACDLVIAGHTNHDTFSAEESIANARWMKAQGAFVEVDTFDSWGLREGNPTPDLLLALVAEGVVDIIASDYAAGHWDGVLHAVEEITAKGLLNLEQAVALVTGNVARAIPSLGRDRGTLQVGKLADFVVTDYEHPADIHDVYVGGELAQATSPEEQIQGKD